ncbi:ketopantoate reductase family protein [Paenibacillus xylaniclasticus]|uniref:ketopantoate reductase family protein n=1 Tax=Paenibacillus xylaniclasticus TaxID=588083 RepID=UPI000FDACAE0|nr:MULTISPECIES: 2-dehydropantoate 2-reductase [Paenibacillus]GFN30381.1 2-dehydropantoate 2-reductase [Paenibacillus curdlanolyticus]
MRFVIVGGGAIGLLYGARLAIAGYPVTIWTRTSKQAELLTDEGIELVRDGSIDIVDVEAYSITEDSRLAARDNEDTVLLITVKQPQLTTELLGRIRVVAEQGSIVIGLQNGVGHIEAIQRFLPDCDVLAGITTEGALRHGPRTVEHTGKGTFVIGKYEVAATANSAADHRDILSQADWNLRETRQKMLVNVFSGAGITAELSNEMINRVYQKLLVNAVINPLTALFDVRNGELTGHSTRLSLMKALHEETLSVLIAAGMVDDGNSWDRLLQVCKSTSSNISSMLSDVRAGRPTEIDWINGGVCRLAADVGMEAPLNRSVMLMIQAIQ